MKPLTSYQANIHRVRRQITRANTAEYDSILTLCQANRDKLVKGISEKTQLDPHIESLTSCQVETGPK